MLSYFHSKLKEKYSQEEKIGRPYGIETNIYANMRFVEPLSIQNCIKYLGKYCHPINWIHGEPCSYLKANNTQKLDVLEWWKSGATNIAVLNWNKMVGCIFDRLLVKGNDSSRSILFIIGNVFIGDFDLFFKAVWMLCWLFV